jgi:xanthine dehydrogenase molybdenum-binding subunit
MDYKVIGTRPIRHDGTDKVTGQAVYGVDVTLPGVLCGKVLRSPHAHARIRSIDISRAEGYEGVKAVIVGEDLQAPNLLAVGKVLFDGHGVAAVAAVNAQVAEEALELIEVEYEVLTPVLNVRQAMREDAVLLHEEMTTESLGEKTDTKSNIAKYFQHILGDVEQGFAAADVVVEREFNTGTVHQGYIEPQNATAKWDADGKLTVWCSTQGAFGVQKQLVGLLGLPLAQVRVIPAEIGGGFGGKVRAFLEPIAAVLSRESGRPVKMVMNRAEVFKATGPTSGSFIRVKMGATRQGQLVAAQAYMAYDAGAFPGSAVGPGARCIFAPYNIENIHIDAYDVVVNKPQRGAYRAPGATNAAFAAETVVDEVAEQLGMDPLAFRLQNSAKEGTRRADGVAYGRIGHEEILQTMQAHPHYLSPLEGPYRGRGVASGFWGNGGGKSSVVASVNADGTVSLVEGSTDIGGTRSSVAMQLAEVLGLAAEDVDPQVADTAHIGFTGVTGGSRTTFATGLAAYEAAQDIARQLVERAAIYWEVDKDKVVFEEGGVRAPDDPSKAMTFKELAGVLHETGGPVVGRATVSPGGVGASLATAMVDVEVDPETGKVDILRCTLFQDAGKAVHPSYVEGQMQGGMVQGIGWALNEEYVYDEQGRLANHTFLDYRMPTALDLPMVEAVIVEVPNPGHPFGVRGVGESSIVPPPAAIANAIYRAIGVRMQELPMSPGRIVKALERKS